jgi:hypothetical protein
MLSNLHNVGSIRKAIYLQHLFIMSGVAADLLVSGRLSRNARYLAVLNKNAVMALRLSFRRVWLN